MKELLDQINAGEISPLRLMSLLCDLLNARTDLTSDQKDALFAQFVEAVLDPKSERPPPSIPASPERDCDIINAYLAGTSVIEIAQHFGITDSRVYQILHRDNVPVGDTTP